jgi:hypothetical protein
MIQPRCCLMRSMPGNGSMRLYRTIQMEVIYHRLKSCGMSGRDTLNSAAAL